LTVCVIRRYKNLFFDENGIFSLEIRRNLNKKIQLQCLLLNKIGNQALAIKWTRELANTLLDEQKLNAGIINKYEQGK
jgi:hypothetical protein